MKPSAYHWWAVTMLAEIYSPAGVDAYMNARSTSLDGRAPRELINQGDGERVLELIRRLLAIA